MTAKASGEALLDRWRLLRKAERLLENIQNSIKERPDLAELHLLSGELTAKMKIWKDKLMTDQKFGTELESMVERYTSILVALSAPKGLPSPDAAAQDNENKTGPAPTLPLR